MQSASLVSPNSLAIALFCSMLETDSISGQALSTTEWSQVALVLMQNNKQPCDLVKSSLNELIEMGFDHAMADRLYRLAQRSIPLGFRINQLHQQGIHLITRADATYPSVFKSKLHQKCPPLFYGIGNFSLLNADSTVVGVVGSRSITQEDQDYVRYVVTKFVEQGYTIVSGGAKGVDGTAIEQALTLGGNVIVYIADRLDKQLRKQDYAKAIYNGQLVILSAHKPDVGFSPAIAMMRNPYIYVQSHATLVVKSDAKKGGTWAGALDNIKHAYAYTLCRDIPYQGNKLLIEQGAIPVDNQWDCNVLSLTANKQLQATVKPRGKATQKSDELSLFTALGDSRQSTPSSTQSQSLMPSAPLAMANASDFDAIASLSSSNGLGNSIPNGVENSAPNATTLTQKGSQEFTPASALYNNQDTTVLSSGDNLVKARNETQAQPLANAHIQQPALGQEVVMSKVGSNAEPKVDSVEELIAQVQDTTKSEVLQNVAPELVVNVQEQEAVQDQSKAETKILAQGTSQDNSDNEAVANAQHAQVENTLASNEATLDQQVTSQEASLEPALKVKAKPKRTRTTKVSSETSKTTSTSKASKNTKPKAKRTRIKKANPNAHMPLLYGLEREEAVLDQASQS